MHTCHHNFQPIEHLDALVERAVFEDIHFDAGQQAEGVIAVVVDAFHQLELLSQPLCAEAIGNLEIGGVIRHGQIFVAKRPRGLHHQLNRAAAVGPTAVAVQIAPERCTQLFSAVGQWS